MCKEEYMKKKEISNLLKVNKDKIIELYLNGKSPREIGDIFNLKDMTIYMFIRRSGIKTRSQYCYRKYSIDETYFEKIDSIQKAYFLGWLMSDGNLYLKDSQIQINLQERDNNILHMFKESIKSDITVKTYKRNNSSFGSGKKYCMFYFGNKKIALDLLKLGMKSQKSLTLEFPTYEQVPKKYIFHFLRGYFEGDGTIGIYKGKDKKIRFKFALLATKEFLTKFIEIFKELGIIFNINTKKDWIEKKINMYNAYTSVKVDIIKILDLLYKDCDKFVLDRKFEIYKKMKQIPTSNSVKHTTSYKTNTFFV